MSGEQTKLHNELAGRIVADIVRPVIGSGGEYKDVLILLESVIVGVAIMAVKMGGDGPVLDLVFERAKERLNEIRLKNAEPAGSA